MIRSILALPDLTEARPEAFQLKEFIQLYVLLKEQGRLPQLTAELEE